MKTVSGEDRSRSASGLSGFVVVNSANSPYKGLFNFIVPDSSDATCSAISKAGDDLKSGVRTQGIPVAGLFTSVSATEDVRAYFVVGK